MKLTISIPCFNEKQNILQTIVSAKALKVDKEIILIDNCSTDGTREILEGFRSDKELRIVLHNKNLGVSFSAIEGIRLATGDYLYGPCADLEYKMEDVYVMLDKMQQENLDAVFGSRLLERGGTGIWPLIKKRPFWLGTVITTFLTNLLYRRSFTDILGTKLMKVSILQSLDFKAHNQTFEFELVSKLCKARFKIGEVPICYAPRTRKQGKTIKALDIVPALWAILRVKIFS